jgi:hypothetical protein
MVRPLPSASGGTLTSSMVLCPLTEVEQQQQEQPKEPTLAELAERIEKLEEYVATQAVPTFDDIYKMFAAVLSKRRGSRNQTFLK